jgi:Ca2+-transporting ATPase
MQEQKWYRVEAEEAAKTLNSDLVRGLSAEEVERRLREFGPNALKEPPPHSILSMFFDQLKEVLVLILIVAAVISGALGEWADSIVIMVIVVLNACLGVYQEHKAEQALENEYFEQNKLKQGQISPC